MKYNHFDANSTNKIEFFLEENCVKFQMIGVYFVLLLVACLFSNSLVLWSFFQYKREKNSLEYLTMVILVINLFGSSLGIPFNISSNFLCRFLLFKLK